MSGKYAFAQTLKEVRFLFCQTGEHSTATRYVSCLLPPYGACVGRTSVFAEFRREDWNKADPPTPRSFLARAYPTMKKNNPNTPIMLREAAGTQPRVYARYGTLRAARTSLSHKAALFPLFLPPDPFATFFPRIQGRTGTRIRICVGMGKW
jgi:NADH dehydrogenase (ubiquinone) 1 alpha subcomplex subunit 2